jgi:hypothetical protein
MTMDRTKSEIGSSEGGHFLFDDWFDPLENGVRTRCIVPASGYYEWRAAEGGKQDPLRRPLTLLLGCVSVSHEAVISENELICLRAALARLFA